MYYSSASQFTFKNSFYLGFLIAVFNFNAAFAQNCSATLKVAKDRNAKSAYTDDGATFNMVLTNTATKGITYIIETKNLTESCATENKKTATPNVPLKIEIKSGNPSSGTAGNSVTLKSGETGTFSIDVSVPPKTPFNAWSCIEVSARGTECNEAAASTVLRVFVPEPSDG